MLLSHFRHVKLKDKGQLISKCLQFPSKNEQKQLNLGFHSSKLESVGSFVFWKKRHLKRSFQLFQTCRDSKFWTFFVDGKKSKLSILF